MKSIVSSTLFSVSMFTAATALASDGTINFEGSVNGESCNIDISQGLVTDNGNPNGLVVLPTIGLSAFSSEGSKAGNTTFNFTLTDCTPDIEVRPYFESNNVSTSTGYLLNTVSELNGGATGIDLEILNIDNEYIDLRSNPEATNKFVNVGSNGIIILHYNVQYTAGLDPTSGDISSALTYTLQYK
ncbi:fimbrial protein [Pseudomonas sp. MS19]|uniref:fimbrial protein n=1 Tax=Pseudomonas sp. MS19 TaxID=2579939 RepID=UPI001561F6A2|nr:fimbrial protein [Pseudomonas sp. MS19]NRH29621.1 type 1 fimbrial protein [Pseudomonas sp. MS19]